MELISRDEAVKMVNKWFNFIKQNKRTYKTKKEPPTIAEGFLIFDYGSRRAAFALLQDDNGVVATPAHAGSR